MTSLIDELQRESVNTADSVSNLLRKALIVATKLEVSDIPEWIEKELSGYTDGDTLPAYRIVHGTVKVRGPHGWLTVQFPTNELQVMISEKFIYISAAQIEALRDGDGRLAMGFPPEAANVLQQMYEYESEFICFLEKTRLAAIIDEIRNRILRWALALEKAGIRGEGLSFTPVEKQKAHAMVFHVGTGNLNVGVVGDVDGRANVATGGNARTGTIDVDDVRKLVDEIRSNSGALRLSVADQRDLQGALREVTAASSGESIEAGMAHRALNRVLGLLGKAGDTALTVATKAAVEGLMRQHGLAP